MGKDGFARLIQEGYWARDCKFRHATPGVSTGHAAFLTGAYPHLTGIGGEGWYSTKEKRWVGSVEDHSTRMVTSNGISKRSGASPRNLKVPTLAEMSRIASNGMSRVLSLSLKKEAAPLMTGRVADLALWFDARSGGFVTSTYYAERLPPWLIVFNDRSKERGYKEAVWDLLQPESAYQVSREDNAPFESSEGDRVFPHAIGRRAADEDEEFSNRMIASPLGDKLLLELVEKSLVTQRIGEDEITDIVCLSFSSNDLVGEIYGPYSREVHDMVLRVDRLVAQLLQILDAKIGKGEYTLFLTSDRGAAPIPEYAHRNGALARHIRLPELQKEIERHLRSPTWGGNASNLSLSALTPPWIYLKDSSNLYLQQTRRVRESLRDWLRQQDGITAAYTTEELREGRFSPYDPWARALALSDVPGRSGDVAFITPPLWVIDPNPQSAYESSGGPFAYDQQVPLLVFGKGIVRGYQEMEPVEPIDIAPTIAALLGIAPPPVSEGRILPRALLPRSIQEPSQ